jgi:Flp pilus assembly protein TadD
MNDRAAAIRGRMKAWGAFRDVSDPWIEDLNADSYDAFQLSVAAGSLKVRGEKQGSRKLLERAVRLSPKNAALHFQYALQLLDLSELAKAKSELELCTQLEPAFADGWAYLSGVLSTLGDAAGAKQAFSEGLAQCPDSPGLHRMNAKQLQAQGHIEEAINEFRLAIRLRPTEADPHVELGMALFAAGRDGEALKEFHQALNAEPENPLVLSTLAFYAITSGDEPAARQWLTRVRNQPRVVANDVEQLFTAYRQKFGHAP